MSNTITRTQLRHTRTCLLCSRCRVEEGERWCSERGGAVEQYAARACPTYEPDLLQAEWAELSWTRLITMRPKDSEKNEDDAEEKTETEDVRAMGCGVA